MIEIHPQKIPHIYVYTTSSYKNRKWTGLKEGKGFLKVGYTTQEDSDDRILQQFPTLQPDNPETLLVTTAIDKNGKFFKDKDVLNLLEKKGFTRVENKGRKTEWVEAKLNDVTDAIKEIKKKEIE